MLTGEQRPHSRKRAWALVCPQKRRRRLHGSGLALPSPGRAHGVEAKFARALHYRFGGAGPGAPAVGIVASREWNLPREPCEHYVHERRGGMSVCGHRLDLAIRGTLVVILVVAHLPHRARLQAPPGTPGRRRKRECQLSCESLPSPSDSESGYI